MLFVSHGYVNGYQTGPCVLEVTKRVSGDIRLPNMPKSGKDANMGLVCVIAQTINWS